MSQRKLSSQRRNQPSQNSPKSKENRVEDKPERNNTDELSKKCVRYFLSRMHTKLPIKRADVIHHVFEERPGKSFDVVIEKAANILKNVYGLNIELIDSDQNAKKYFVSNVLPFASLIPSDEETDMKSTILFLVLTHIFMSKNNSTDNSLWNFLNEFDITPRTECKHIGSINTYITQTLVKQNYIVMENRSGENDEGEMKKRFRWGSRAEEVISKMDILKFVSEQYENQVVEVWEEQYIAAREQFAGTEND